jgi:hypothetical protein
MHNVCKDAQASLPTDHPSTYTALYEYCCEAVCVPKLCYDATCRRLMYGALPTTKGVITSCFR